MQRLLAVLLAVSFSFPLMIPFLSASPDDQLPPCCRRDGKHGCGMKKKSSASTGLTVKSSNDTCPLYPVAKSTPIGDRIQPPAPRGFAITLIAAAPLAAQMEVRYRISFNRSSQKRGPPVSSQA